MAEEDKRTGAKQTVTAFPQDRIVRNEVERDGAHFADPAALEAQEISKLMPDHLIRSAAYRVFGIHPIEMERADMQRSLREYFETDPKTGKPALTHIDGISLGNPKGGLPAPPSNALPDLVSIQKQRNAHQSIDSVLNRPDVKTFSVEDADISNPKLNCIALRFDQPSHIKGKHLHINATNGEWASQNFNHVQFLGSTMPRLIQNNGTIHVCHYHKVDMPYSVWGEQTLKETLFTDTVGKGLSYALFNHSNLYKVHFGSAQKPYRDTKMVMDKAAFGDRTSLDEVQFYRTSLKYTKFDQSDLYSTHFRHCDLSGANFNHCTLSNVSFSHCQTEGLTFENTAFDRVDFTRFSHPENLSFIGKCTFGNTEEGTTCTFPPALRRKLEQRGLIPPLQAIENHGDPAPMLLEDKSQLGVDEAIPLRETQPTIPANKVNRSTIIKEVESMLESGKMAFFPHGKGGKNSTPSA